MDSFLVFLMSEEVSPLSTTINPITRITEIIAIKPKSSGDKRRARSIVPKKDMPFKRNVSTKTQNIPEMACFFKSTKNSLNSTTFHQH